MTARFGDDETMALTEFQALAEIHGGRLALWPEDRRAAAARLAETDAAAAEALADAAAIDALLDAAASEALEPSADLTARMLADAAMVSAEAGAPAVVAEVRSTPSSPRRGMGAWIEALFGGAGLAAAAAAGFVVGLAGVDAGVETADADDPFGVGGVEIAWEPAGADGFGVGWFTLADEEADG